MITIKVDVFHHLSGDDTSKKLDEILTIVKDIRQKENKSMIDLTAIKEKVTIIKGTLASTQEFIALVAAKIIELSGQIANSVDPAEIAALNLELADVGTQLLAQKDELAAAVAANPIA